MSASSESGLRPCAGYCARRGIETDVGKVDSPLHATANGDQDDDDESVLLEVALRLQAMVWGLRGEFGDLEVEVRAARRCRAMAGFGLRRFDPAWRSMHHSLAEWEKNAKMRRYRCARAWRDIQSISDDLCQELGLVDVGQPQVTWPTAP